MMKAYDAGCIGSEKIAEEIFRYSIITKRKQYFIKLTITDGSSLKRIMREKRVSLLDKGDRLAC
jgi:hypothetical protein